ncbi:AAA family ATPase [uncultured Thomasclavelia sp.]|uniref:AAA family ATPase n=1 Tax=uncultured Thomasclavelia sp. TaxID=3025759 RepID=UPI0026246C06|nr:AAA family ATPase [uncultured Thomasclavelia sp.]
MMRINNVSIKNYRQYYDFNISFDRKNGKSLYTLIARNGTGKSNFLNAITWCLYHKETHSSAKNKSLPILSLKKLRDIDIGDIANVSVEIALKNEENDIFIKRTQSYKKTGDVTEPIFALNNILEVNYIGEKNASYIGEDASKQIKKLLPDDLMQYFFFDNEQMDQFFEENRANSIRESIHSISQVSLLEKMENRFETIENDYIKKIGKKLPNIKKLQNEYEGYKSQVDDRNNEIQSLNKQIEISKKIIKECETYLNGIGDIRELHKKQDELKDLKDSVINQQIEIIKSIKKFAVEYSTLIRLYPDLLNLNELITQMESAGKLPPKIDIDFLRQMLKDNICYICDNENLNEKERAHIQYLIDQIEVPNRISHLLKGISGYTSDLILKAEKYPEKKNDLFSKKRELDKMINYYEDQIDSLQSEINKCADEKKAQEQNDLKLQHEKVLETNRNKLANFKLTYQSLINKMLSAKEDLNKAIKKNNTNKELELELERTKELNRYIKDIKEDLIYEMKAKISEETFELFDSMVWKNNTYKKVVIDDNYNVDLINYDGYSALGSCSAAERSLLALSFTLALHNVSGFDAPIIIDSPVGRISDTNREEFAKVLVDVSKKKEVIMLFTPSEYSSEVAPLLDKESTGKVVIEVSDDESETLLNKEKSLWK